MSYEEALKKSIFSQPIPRVRASVASPPTPSVYDLPELMSPVPSKVVEENGISTYTLPDGREFRLDSRGNPYISKRNVTAKQKSEVRGGSFAEKGAEVDHMVSIGLGGTNTTSNLQILKSKKTVSQTVWDFITGKQSEIGDYKPENRQEGKMIVEQKAINKYRAGEIGLFEAMAAVQHYDNKEMVADFLHEEYKPTILERVKESPAVQGAVDFLKKKVRQKAMTNTLKLMQQSPRFRDKEDGVALIHSISEKVNQFQSVSEKQELGTGAITGAIKLFSPTFAMGKPMTLTEGKELVTAPVRLLAGSLAKFLVNYGLEKTGSDAKFSPGSYNQQLIMGKEDFERFSTSKDIYGEAFRASEKMFERAGLDADQAHKSAMASVLLLGVVFENPFNLFGKGSKVAKEGVEEVLQQALKREFSIVNLSDDALKMIKGEAERISLLVPEQRGVVFEEFVKGTKALPRELLESAPVKVADNVPVVGQTADVSARVPADIAPEKIPETLKEFNALDEKLQEAMLQKLSPELQYKIFLGEEKLEVGGSPVDRLVREIVNGDIKIHIPKQKADKEEIRNIIGRGRYAQIFRPQSFLSHVDELASSVGVSQDELLEAIAKAGKEKVNRPKFLDAKQGLTQLVTRKGLARSIEEQTEQVLTKIPKKYSQKVSSLPRIVERSVTDVKQKINLFDYLRTPERVLRKIGFENEAKLLRTGYEAYVKELPKNIDKITAWSKQVGKKSNERIFQFLDGKAVELDETERSVASEVQIWLKEWADRLGLPKDNRIASYITHLFDEELLKKEFDEDLAKIIANKIPGEVYDPFLEKRLGARGYIQDTWKALDAYVKRGTRKVHMDSALEAIKTKAGKTLETSPLEQSQFEYLKKFIDHVNLRPTKLDTMIDNTIKSLIGYKFGQRPVTRLTKLLRQMTYRGMLGLNPGSALRNISQGINTYAVLGEKYTTIGYANLFKSGAFNEIKGAGILTDNFIQDRTLSSTKKAMEKVDKGLFFFFEMAERINRGAAYFGAKSKALDDGKTIEEAMEFGREIVRKTQFAFSSIDTPVGLQSDIAKTLSQFQTFTLKQIEFLSEMALDKNFIGLIRYAVAGTVFVYTIGQAFGMEIKDLVPTFRFGPPPSLKLPVEATKAILGVPDNFGRERDLRTKVEDVAESGLGLVPAGIQVKKTFQGAKAIKEGGSFNKAGSLQFEVGESLPKRLQTLAFGKFATKEAKVFFNKKDKVLIQKTAEFLLSIPKEQAAQEFDAFVEKRPELAEKLNKELDDLESGITQSEKELRNLGVANGQRAKEVKKKLDKLKTDAERADLWDEYVEKKIITKEIANQLDELYKQN